MGKFVVLECADHTISAGVLGFLAIGLISRGYSVLTLDSNSSTYIGNLLDDYQRFFGFTQSAADADNPLLLPADSYWQSVLRNTGLPTLSEKSICMLCALDRTTIFDNLRGETGLEDFIIGTSYVDTSRAFHAGTLEDWFIDECNSESRKPELTIFFDIGDIAPEGSKLGAMNSWYRKNYENRSDVITIVGEGRSSIEYADAAMEKLLSYKGYGWG